MSMHHVIRTVSCVAFCLSVPLAVHAQGWDCTHASPIVSVPGAVAGVTSQHGNPHWYVYIPTTSGTLSLDFAENHDDNNRYTVKLGCLTHGATADRSIYLIEDELEPNSIPVYWGLRYYIIVQPAIYHGGSYTLTLDGPSGGGVQNAYSSIYCTSAYRVHPGAISGNGNVGYDDLWYEYVPAGNGTLTLTFLHNEEENGWQTEFSLLTGNCGSHTYLIQDEDTQGSAQVYAGVHYLLRMNAPIWHQDLTYILHINGPGILDGCPYDPWKASPGQCGCGVADTDDDGDGVANCIDVCDGFDDNLDCNGNSNPDGCDIRDGISLDCNLNGIPDECDLEDGTSTDCNENDVPDDCEPDGDGDGIIDDCDNCPDTYNPDQQDSDDNGVGDACEFTLGDLNCDGLINLADVDPFVLAIAEAAAYQAAFPDCQIMAGDVNGDGFVDLGDVDLFVDCLSNHSCD